jgi:thioredoxin reductase
LTCKTVVIATGHVPFRYMPETLNHLPADLVSHSLEVTEPAKFAGRDVTIVGLGQSALETAALLHEAGANVCVVGREPNVAWNGPPRPNPGFLDQIKAPDAGLGAGWRSYLYSEYAWAFRQLPAARRFRIFKSSWGPSGAWWLEERVAGKVPILLDRQIDDVQEAGGRLRLRLHGAGVDTEIVTDHIIAGTGFAVDFDRLSYIEPSLRARVAVLQKAPILSPSFETNVPGLYAIGLMSAPTFGPALRFMYGAKFAAATVARSIARGTRRFPRAKYVQKVPVVQ